MSTVIHFKDDCHEDFRPKPGREPGATYLSPERREVTPDCVLGPEGMDRW